MMVSIKKIFGCILAFLSLSWGGIALAVHTVEITTQIQLFMSDLFIVDGSGASLAGYYNIDKSVSYVTGYNIRDSGDELVLFYIGAFDDNVPVGAEIQVEMDRNLGWYGTSFTRKVEIQGHDQWDLTGVNKGKIKVISLSEAFSMYKIKDYNGTYNVTLKYNGYSKSFKIVVQAN